MNIALFRYTALAAAIMALSLQAASAQQAPARPAAAPAAPAAEIPLPAKGTNVVVIDADVIQQDALAFVALRTQYDRQRAAMTAEVAKVENDLRNADQDLGRQRTVLSPDAFGDRQRALQKRFADAQQDVQNRRRDLEQAFATANNKVINEMLIVVRDLAQENDFKLVFAKSQIVTLDPKLEITGEVLKRLNKKVPNVTVAVPPAK